MEIQRSRTRRRDRPPRNQVPQARGAKDGRILLFATRRPKRRDVVRAARRGQVRFTVGAAGSQDRGGVRDRERGAPGRARRGKEQEAALRQHRERPPRGGGPEATQGGGRGERGGVQQALGRRLRVRAGARRVEHVEQGHRRHARPAARAAERRARPSVLALPRSSRGRRGQSNAANIIKERSSEDERSKSTDPRRRLG